MYISVGVGGLVVLLIAVPLVLISVTVCLRQREKRILITSSNVAYSTTTSGGLSMETLAHAYDYVSTNTPHTSENAAYGIAVEDVNYSGVTQNEIELKDNKAYGGVAQNVELKENEAYIATATGGVEEEYEYVRNC